MFRNEPMNTVKSAKLLLLLMPYEKKYNPNEKMAVIRSGEAQMNDRGFMLNNWLVKPKETKS
jgi:hypothetical protein